MLKTIVNLLVTFSLLLTGYCIAVYFQWSLDLTSSHSHTHFIPLRCADGSVISFPQDTDEESTIIRSTPYRDVHFDLFGDGNTK